MSNWGGILASAMGGAAEAVTGMARGQIEDERKLKLQQTLSEMEEQKAIAAEARREAMQIAAEQRQGASARDQATWAATDPKLREAQRTKLQEETDIRGAADLKNRTSIIDYEADTRKKQLLDPELRKAELERIAAEAKARHFESGESVARAELIRQQLDDLKSGKADKREARSLVVKGMERLSELEMKAANPGIGDDERAYIRKQIARTDQMLQSVAQQAGIEMPQASTSLVAPTPGAINLARTSKDPAADKPVFERNYGAGSWDKARAGMQDAGKAGTAGEPARPDAGKRVTEPVEPPEAKALDTARAQLDAAKGALQRYGSVQRQADPEGFARAQAAYEQAQAAAQAATQAYQRVVSAPGAAFRTAAP